MGAYSSSFITDPKSSVAVASFSHPSKPNWITAHAIATECMPENFFLSFTARPYLKYFFFLLNSKLS